MNRKDIPFVISDLPQTSTDLAQLVKKHCKDDESKLKVLLKRIIDYHSPLGTGDFKKENVEKFSTFVGLLLQMWIEGHSRAVLTDLLKELLSQSQDLNEKAEKHGFRTPGDVIIQVLQDHNLKVCDFIDSKTIEGIVEAFDSQMIIMDVLIEIMGNPSCKILDICLAQTSTITHLYTDRLFQ